MRIRQFAAIVAIAVMCGREGVAVAKAAATPPVPQAPAQAAAAPLELAAAQGGPEISGHFTLQSLDGHEVTDSTYRGKWLLVYFGYTSCPDVCPTVLLRVGQALDSLGKLAERVQPIFITVDPARDTKERLSKYMAAFNSRIIGLRGSPDQTKEAARQFHVYYRARSLGNDAYTVDHSSFLYVVSPEGHFEKLLADSLPTDQLVAELRALVSHFADADDLAKVKSGKALYAHHCANCHGRQRQGQPLWQLQDQFAGRRAPAHDQTGHTWAHSDDDLFWMTRDGRFPASPAQRPSYMPAFHDSLTNEQIIAVIAYIKASWPIGLRISQAMLNPGNAGMPAVSADDADWTLPPTCTISAQLWRTTSR
jgi:protein SCO1/2